MTRKKTAEPGLRRAWPIVLYLAAIAALLVQLVPVVPASPTDPGASSLIDLGPSSAADPTALAAEPKLIWRTFRPGQRLAVAPTGWICDAALQRGEQRAALIVRLCVEQPLSPQRRFGLGFDSFVLDVQLPGGNRLSYSLLNYRAAGPWSAQDFTQGLTTENTVPVRGIFVRDYTDIVVELDVDVPVGLPTVSVRGTYAGMRFADTQPFDALGPTADAAALELRHAADAPIWARLRP